MTRSRRSEDEAPVCPGCGDRLPPAGEHSPFCSLRCKAEDLHGWLSGANALPTWDVEEPGLYDDADAY